MSEPLPAPSGPYPAFMVGGVRIHAIRLGDVVETIGRWIDEERRDYIVLTGAHGVIEMQSDDELREINNVSGLTTPDGQPMVWLGRRAGFPRIEKVYAPDIMERVWEAGAKAGWRSYLYGGKEGVADQLADVVTSRFPGNRIAGTYCPPFRPLTDDEVREVADDINSSEADIVWIGLGCPKQERWMAQFRPLVKAPVLIGVGAGFDFLTGEASHAPRWIQHSGFEWLYRMVSEPKRLWPRYSRVVPRFFLIALREYLRKPRVIPPESA